MLLQSVGLVRTSRDSCEFEFLTDRAYQKKNLEKQTERISSSRNRRTNIRDFGEPSFLCILFSIFPFHTLIWLWSTIHFSTQSTHVKKQKICTSATKKTWKYGIQDDCIASIIQDKPTQCIQTPVHPPQIMLNRINVEYLRAISQQ